MTAKFTCRYCEISYPATAANIKIHATEHYLFLALIRRANMDPGSARELMRDPDHTERDRRLCGLLNSCPAEPSSAFGESDPGTIGGP